MSDNSQFRYKRDAYKVLSEYLFTWNDIPGNENVNKSFLRMLNTTFDLTWITTTSTHIVKNDDQTVITVANDNDNQQATLTLNSAESTVILYSNGIPISKLVTRQIKNDIKVYLDVSRNSDPNTIERIGKLILNKYRPSEDLNDSETKKQYEESLEAFKILSDPEKKRKYDQLFHIDVSNSESAPRILNSDYDYVQLPLMGRYSRGQRDSCWVAVVIPGKQLNDDRKIYLEPMETTKTDSGDDCKVFYLPLIEGRIYEYAHSGIKRQLIVRRGTLKTYKEWDRGYALKAFNRKNI